MLRALAEYGYSRDVGPGVFDVHSPVVPTTEAMEAKLLAAVGSGLLAGTPGRIWAVPDVRRLRVVFAACSDAALQCGLKTRSWAQVVPSLRHMVAAAAGARVKLSASRVLPAGGVGSGL